MYQTEEQKFLHEYNARVLADKLEYMIEAGRGFEFVEDRQGFKYDKHSLEA